MEGDGRGWKGMEGERRGEEKSFVSAALLS
jgi:hypothetical protein